MSDGSLDVDFRQAVMRAGRGFVKARDKKPEKEGAALAKYLNSDKPLSKAERSLLAELVTGEWRYPDPVKGQNMKVKTAGNAKVKKVVCRLRELMNEGVQKTAAKYRVKEELDVSISSVENYEKIVLQREKAVEKAKEDLGSKP